MRSLPIVIGLLAAVFGSLDGRAQEHFSVSGTLLDTTGASLPGATVMVSSLPERTLAGFAFSDERGEFKIELDSAGRYEVKVTYVGYGTFANEIEVTQSSELDLGKITLSQDAITLDGVTVEGRFRPIVVRNDTIEYDADSFHAGEGATVEDLLKNLPGVTVEDDGTVKAQGEEVQKVLVDGKEFFEKDPKVATRNIPADVVDKVQVFDDESDFTKFTGIKDGEKEKAINLAIKEGKNKGTFGELKAEYGTEESYNFGANINRFNERMQLSVLGNMNNISDQAFTVQDYLQFNGGLDGMMSAEVDLSELPMNLLRQRGITESGSGGVNFNYEFGKKTELRSNYFYDRSINNTISNNTVGNFLTDGNYLNLGEGDERNEFSNHRMKLSLEHKFNKKKVLTLRLGGSLSEPIVSSISDSRSLLNDTIVNGSNTRSEFSTNINRWNGQLVYRSKFKKAGRFFTTDLKLNGERKEGSGGVFSLLGPMRSDTLQQQQVSDGDELGYSAALNYVEPVGPSHYLYFKVLREQNFRDNTKLFYAGDRVDPGQRIDALSNGFDRDLSRTVFGLKFQITKSKWLASLGADAQKTELDNRDRFSDERIGSAYWNVLPNAMLTWKRTTASNVELRYRTRIQVPDIRQLQPVLDNTDPLNLYQGDPDLDPEYMHLLNLRYHNFNEFYFRSFFAGVQSRVKNNAIAERSTVSNDLVSLRAPVNSAAEWELLGFYEYSSPIMDANFKYRLNGEYGTERYNVLINDLNDRLTMDRIDQRIRIENKKKKVLDWNLGTRGRFRLMSYDQSTVFDQDLINIDLFANAKITFLKHWRLELKGKQRQYLPNDFVGRTELYFLDAKLSRSFWDKALHIYIRGINLLDETDAVRRDAFGNSYSEVFTDRLGRLILVGVSYKIRSFGK